MVDMPRFERIVEGELILSNVGSYVEPVHTFPKQRHLHACFTSMSSQHTKTHTAEYTCLDAKWCKTSKKK